MNCKVFSIIFLLVSALLTSCLSSNENDTVTYSDTALTGFNLGVIKYSRTYTTKSSKGEDSTYTRSYTYSAAALYPMHINQNKNLVYNTDSLVWGSDLTKVVCSINTLNGGTVFFQNLETPTQYDYYNTGDSLDLSKERILRVVSNDGTKTRDYTVRVAAYKSDPTIVLWDKAPINSASSKAMLASLNLKKAICSSKGIYLFAKKDNTPTLLFSDNGKDWAVMENINCNGIKDIALHNDTVFATKEGEMMKIRPDGTCMNISLPTAATILGGSSNELFAMTDGGIIVSKDGGNSWNNDKTDKTAFVDNDMFLPKQDFCAVASNLKTNDGITRMTIVGNVLTNDNTTALPDFKNAVTWSKIIDPNIEEDNAMREVWNYCVTAGYNHYSVLPRMKNITLASFKGAMIAMGGTQPLNPDAKSYNILYRSLDGGITWDKNAIALPTSFQAGSSVVVTNDKNGNLLIISNGDVWKANK